MTTAVQVRVAEADADAERLESLAALLRQELLELDVDAVEPVPEGVAPPGSRALDVLAVGALLVKLGESAGVGALVRAVRSWLSRGGGAARTVKLEIDGDVLELTGASRPEQERLVELFVRRHEPG